MSSPSVGCIHLKSPVSPQGALQRGRSCPSASALGSPPSHLFKQNPASQFSSQGAAACRRVLISTNKSSIGMGWETPPPQVVRNTVGQLRPDNSGRSSRRSEVLRSAEEPKRTCSSLCRERLRRDEMLNVWLLKYCSGLFTSISHVP